MHHFIRPTNIKKYSLTSVFVLLFTIYAVGQVRILDLTTNALEATANDLEIVWGLDVFAYFNLDSYDTELKKSVYKRTAEYQTYLTQLKEKKAGILKNTYYIKLSDEFKDNDYDVKRKGFEIMLGENWGFGTNSARAPKSLFSFLLKSLPTRQVPEPELGKGISKEVLFLNIDESAGIEIENDKRNIDIYFFFTPSGMETSSFKFYNGADNGYGGWYNMTKKSFKTDKVRVVIANKSTGKIYFDKQYNSLPAIK